MGLDSLTFGHGFGFPYDNLCSDIPPISLRLLMDMSSLEEILIQPSNIVFPQKNMFDCGVVAMISDSLPLFFGFLNDISILRNIDIEKDFRNFLYDLMQKVLTNSITLDQFMEKGKELKKFFEKSSKKKPPFTKVKSFKIVEEKKRLFEKNLIFYKALCESDIGEKFNGYIYDSYCTGHYTYVLLVQAGTFRRWIRTTFEMVKEEFKSNKEANNYLKNLINVSKNQECFVKIKRKEVLKRIKDLEKVEKIVKEKKERKKELKRRKKKVSKKKKKLRKKKKDRVKKKKISSDEEFFKSLSNDSLSDEEITQVKEKKHNVSTTLATLSSQPRGGKTKRKPKSSMITLDKKEELDLDLKEELDLDLKEELDLDLKENLDLDLKEELDASTTLATLSSQPRGGKTKRRTKSSMITSLDSNEDLDNSVSLLLQEIRSIKEDLKFVKEKIAEKKITKPLQNVITMKELVQKSLFCLEKKNISLSSSCCDFQKIRKDIKLFLILSFLRERKDDISSEFLSLSKDLKMFYYNIRKTFNLLKKDFDKKEIDVRIYEKSKKLKKKDFQDFAKLILTKKSINESFEFEKKIIEEFIGEKKEIALFFNTNIEEKDKKIYLNNFNFLRKCEFNEGKIVFSRCNEDQILKELQILLDLDILNKIQMLEVKKYTYVLISKYRKPLLDVIIKKHLGEFHTNVSTSDKEIMVNCETKNEFSESKIEELSKYFIFEELEKKVKRKNPMCSRDNIEEAKKKVKM